MAQINEVDESAQRDWESKEFHSESTEVHLKCMNFATFLMLLMNKLLFAACFDFTLTFACRFLDIFYEPRIPSGLQKRKGRGVALLKVFDNIYDCHFVSHSSGQSMASRRQFALPTLP